LQSREVVRARKHRLGRRDGKVTSKFGCHSLLERHTLWVLGLEELLLIFFDLSLLLGLVDGWLVFRLIFLVLLLLSRSHTLGLAWCLLLALLAIVGHSLDHQSILLFLILDLGELRLECVQIFLPQPEDVLLLKCIMLLFLVVHLFDECFDALLSHTPHGHAQ
jgi:hypothetical protein